MKRKFRLTRSTEFKRVRLSGKSFAHPLIVLIVYRTSQPTVRVGVAAGRSVGCAVERNRAKRRIRACIDGLLPRLTPGWDVVLLARKPMTAAQFTEIEAAINLVFTRAGLLVKGNSSASSA